MAFLAAHVSALSPSKLRRARATATRKKLFLAAENGQEDLIEDLQSKLDALLSAVNALQSIVFGAVVQVPCFMPYGAYGQEPHWNAGYEESSNFCDPSLPLAEPYVASFLNIGSKNAGCEEAAISGEDYCNWQLSSQDIFRREGSRIWDELQGEAAACIQRHYRLFVASRSQYESSCDSSNVAECPGCFQEVDKNSPEADSCDTCGRPLHAKCVIRFRHPIEAYRVCTDCAEVRREAGEESVQGISDTETEKEQATEEALQEPIQVELSNQRGLQPLDATLDYICKFLEGGHAKSDSVTSQIRSEILSKLRATLEWKKHIRTDVEIKAKVEELNGMMMRVVQNM